MTYPPTSWMGRDHYPVKEQTDVVIASDGSMTGDPQAIADLMEFLAVRANLNSDSR